MLVLITAALAATAQPPATPPADPNAQHQGMAKEGEGCACCKDMAKDGTKKGCCAEHADGAHADHGSTATNS